jgi:peptide/nickel transport system permease protein
VLRHAVLPALTLSGWALGALISGAVIVETVFARPGIGNVLVTATESRDLPLVSGVVILVAAIYVLANLIVDIAYVLIDPRMRAA